MVLEEYRFRYRVTPSDLTILSLASIYRTVPGVVNIVFTISMILVAARFWNDPPWVYRALMILGFVAFPILQPVAIYLRSMKIVSRIPNGLDMHIGPRGISISSQDETTALAYSDLTAPQRIAGMIIIRTRGTRGYVLSRRVLGQKSEAVYDQLKRRIPTDRS